MEAQRKRKGSNVIFIHKHHLCLHDLKMYNQDLKNIYLVKTNVPEYPRPEFHVSDLRHDTQQGGLLRIWKDEGFKDPHGGLKDPDSLSLVWWSLVVGPQEIQSAETRLLDKFYPNRMEKQAEKKPSYLDEIYPDRNKQESFLWKFATSPAFGEKSRFGSYRFTFPLKDVVTAYSQQSRFGCVKAGKKGGTKSRTCGGTVLLRSSAHYEGVQDFAVQTGSAVLCADPQPSQREALLRVSFACL